MTTLTKEKAWIIFRADKLGHAEAQGAFKSMSKAEFDAYECWAEDFELELAKIGIEATNEAAALTETPESIADLTNLEAKPRHTWLVNDYEELLDIFRGSKFEALHLSAMFGVPNNELLLELVKP